VASRSKDQGILVGEILVQRTDADAGRLGHEIGIGLGIATLDEHARHGIKDGIDHRPRTRLARFFSGLQFHWQLW
jgi:hypothetical protein